MATVPGDPQTNVQPMLPKAFEPTMADFLQAAHITTERQRLAGDVKDLSSYFQGAQDMNKALRLNPTPKEQTEQTLKRALGAGKVLPMAPKDE